MPRYVDGFVMVVPKKKIAAYRLIAAKAGKLWKKLGALDYKECVMEDPKPQYVTLTFSKLTKLKAGETVVFSYIVFKSRAHRDLVNAKVMKHPSMQPLTQKDNVMPFDMKRVSYAGFKVLVDA